MGLFFAKMAAVAYFYKSTASWMFDGVLNMSQVQ